jgi:P27 family predicted phage terminase small subunit
MGKRGPVGIGAKRTRGKAAAVDTSYFLPSAYLSTLAKEYWNQIVASLSEGHFTECDRVLMEQYCTAAAVHRNATVRLEKEGRRYKDKNCVWRKSPLVDDQHQARCDCAMLATKLRITKTSMISPKVAGRAAHDVAEALIIKDDIEGLLFTNMEAKQ